MIEVAFVALPTCQLDPQVRLILKSSSKMETPSRPVQQVSQLKTSDLVIINPITAFAAGEQELERMEMREREPILSFDLFSESSTIREDQERRLVLAPGEYNTLMYFPYIWYAGEYLRREDLHMLNLKSSYQRGMNILEIVGCFPSVVENSEKLKLEQLTIISKIYTSPLVKGCSDRDKYKILKTMELALTLAGCGRRSIPMPGPALCTSDMDFVAPGMQREAWDVSPMDLPEAFLRGSIIWKAFQHKRVMLENPADIEGTDEEREEIRMRRQYFPHALFARGLSQVSFDLDVPQTLRRTLKECQHISLLSALRLEAVIHRGSNGIVPSWAEREEDESRVLRLNFESKTRGLLWINHKLGRRIMSKFHF